MAHSHCRVSSGRTGTGQRVPWTPFGANPRDNVVMAVSGGAGASQRVPGAAVRTKPLDNIQAAGSGGTGTYVGIPRTAIAACPLENAQVPTGGQPRGIGGAKLGRGRREVPPRVLDPRGGHRFDGVEVGEDGGDDLIGHRQTLSMRGLRWCQQHCGAVVNLAKENAKKCRARTPMRLFEWLTIKKEEKIAADDGRERAQTPEPGSRPILSR